MHHALTHRTDGISLCLWFLFYRSITIVGCSNSRCLLRSIFQLFRLGFLLCVAYRLSHCCRDIRLCQKLAHSVVSLRHHAMTVAVCRSISLHAIAASCFASVSQGICHHGVCALVVVRHTEIQSHSTSNACCGSGNPQRHHLCTVLARQRYHLTCILHHAGRGRHSFLYVFPQSVWGRLFIVCQTSLQFVFPLFLHRETVNGFFYILLSFSPSAPWHETAATPTTSALYSIMRRFPCGSCPRRHIG